MKRKEGRGDNNKKKKSDGRFLLGRRKSLVRALEPLQAGWG